MCRPDTVDPRGKILQKYLRHSPSQAEDKKTPMPGWGRPLSSTPWMQRTPPLSSTSYAPTGATQPHHYAHEVAEVEKSSLRVNSARLVAVKPGPRARLRASVLSSPTSLATPRERSGWTDRGCGSPRDEDALDAATFCYGARLPHAIRWIRVNLFFGTVASRLLHKDSESLDKYSVLNTLASDSRNGTQGAAVLRRRPDEAGQPRAPRESSANEQTQSRRGR
jgi:hypothetical protein